MGVSRQSEVSAGSSPTWVIILLAAEWRKAGHRGLWLRLYDSPDRVHNDSRSVDRQRDRIVECVSQYPASAPIAIRTRNRRRTIIRRQLLEKGLEAAEAVAAARRTLAEIVGLPPTAVVFTAGGTEADVLALRGVFARRARAARARSLVVSAVEHPAVLETARALGERRRRGADRRRRTRTAASIPRRSPALVDATTVLVSIMHVNNETGAVQPIAELSRARRRRRTRARSSTSTRCSRSGATPCRSRAGPTSTWSSIAAHKIYGPKGVGALFVRPGTRLAAGAHRRRPGGRAALGHAQRAGHRRAGRGRAAARRDARPTDMARYAALAARFLDGLAARVPDARLNGARDEARAVRAARAVHRERALPRRADRAAAPRARGRGVLVVGGLGLPRRRTRPVARALRDGLTGDGACLRFSFGRATTEADVDAALDALARALPRLRGVARA